MLNLSRTTWRVIIRCMVSVGLLVFVVACASTPAQAPVAPTTAPQAAAPKAAAPTTAPAAAPTTAPAAAPKAAATTAPAAAPKAAATTAPAAGASALPADAATEQVLRLGMQGFGSQEPLAPWSVRWGGGAVGAFEFLTPVTHDVDFNLKPLLATAITPNADFTVWTMKIDPRAKWSDGTKLTAKHVKDSYEWVTAPAQKTSNITGAALAGAKGFSDMADGKAQEITGLVVKDDVTLEIQLNSADRFLDHKFASYWLGVVPAEKLKADANYLAKPNPLVNGPYQVTSVDTTGRQIVLSRNPQWWGDKPIIDRIEVTVAEEASSWELLFERGNVDFAQSFADAATRRKLGARVPGSQETATKLPAGIYSSFHWGVPPVDDLNVRKALVHAIDFKELAAASTDGLQKEWLGLLHPELLQGCYTKDHEKYFEFNPTKAKEYLAASKYKTVEGLGKLRITSNSSGASQKKALQIIQEMWRTNLGITDVEFKEQPAGFAADEKLVNLDRQSIGARPPDDGLWVGQFVSTGIHATRFMAGYKNEALDKILAQVAAMDRKDPNFCKTVQEAERIFLEDYMWVPLWRQSGDFSLVQPWTKGLYSNSYSVLYSVFLPPYAYIAKH